MLLLGLVTKLVAIDLTVGFGAALFVTGECPPVTCARNRPQLVDYCDDAASRFGWSVCVAINCSGSPCRVGCGCHRPFFLFCPTQEVSLNCPERQPHLRKVGVGEGGGRGALARRTGASSTSAFKRALAGKEVVPRK